MTTANSDTTAKTAGASTNTSADAPIVTLTLNPTLDVSWSVETVVPSHKLRVDPDRAEPGGGGVNVSRVCQRLGHPTVAVVAVGGPIGHQICELLTDGPMPLRSIPITGDSRQSISVTERSTRAQYRFVLPGPTITHAELEQAIAAAIEEAGDHGSIVVSGSVPPGVDAAFLGELARAIGGRRLIIDTSGPGLGAALQSGAYLVKPSVSELGRLVGEELHTEADVRRVATQVLNDSNVEVLVASIGSGGAFAVSHSGGRYRLRAPTVRVRSTVGAGDSMVAGMAIGLQRTGDLEYALIHGVSCGTAAVMTDGTDLCHASDIEALEELVGLEVLEH